MNIRAWAARSVTVALGACSVAWAVYAFDIFRAEAAINGSAQSIRAGETYGAAHLDLLRKQLDTAGAKLSGAQALDDAAVIRLRLLETDPAAGQSERRASDRETLEAALRAALSATPTDSFLWLAEYWIQDPAVRASDRGQKLLRMSYLSGPNEAWIAVKRNPIALAAYSSLPSDMTEQVLTEFVRMVHSELYLQTADSIAASGPGLRKLLLGRTAELEEAYRRGLARALASKDVKDAVVPGIDNRPARPF